MPTIERGGDELMSVGLGIEPPDLIVVHRQIFPRRLHVRQKRRHERLGRVVRQLAAAGYLCVVATHDLNFAAGLCRTLLLLRDGRVLAGGPTREVLTKESVLALYDVEADVTYHQGAGHLTVVPLRRTRGAE